MSKRNISLLLLSALLMTACSTINNPSSDVSSVNQVYSVSGVERYSDELFDGRIGFSTIVDENGEPLFSKYTDNGKGTMFSLVDKNKKTRFVFNVNNPIDQNEVELRYKSFQKEYFFYSMSNTEGTKSVLCSFNIKAKTTTNIPVKNYVFIGNSGKAYVLNGTGVSVYDGKLSEVSKITGLTINDKTELFAVKKNDIFYSTDNSMYVYLSQEKKEKRICDCGDLILQVMNIQITKDNIYFIAMGGENGDEASLYRVNEKTNKPEKVIASLNNILSFAANDTGVYYTVWDNSSGLFEVRKNEGKCICKNFGKKVLYPAKGCIINQEKGVNDGSVYLFDIKKKKNAKVFP
ncbi:MAG: hypothetical protein K5639_06645 [Eubacterium sp.]|nr:hypothetical protein [Eubacterium sp.]